MSITSTMLEDGTLFGWDWMNERLSIQQEDQHISFGKEDIKALKEFLEKHPLL